MTALLFGIMTLVFVGPAPEALSRAQWPIRAPVSYTHLTLPTSDLV